MAKLSVAYGLCPLIDQKSLLGVSNDAAPGYVIVTMGRNIVIRYRLQDQKQVGSWSTKEKLTSPVIYDASISQYVGVFNHNLLRMWTDHDSQLNKVKKYKFEEPIHCILPQTDGDPSIVLFCNGCVAVLTVAVESCKETVSGPVLKRDEAITDTCIVSNTGRKLVTFITQHPQNSPTLHVVPIVLGKEPSQHALVRNDVPNVYIIGQTVVQGDDSCTLLTFWSDGKLFSFPFLPHTQEEFPGTLINTVTAVNTKKPAVLVALSSNHIVLFGSDPSEEGATLLLLNLQFTLVQSRLHFKLYTKPPRLWNLGANLLVAVANSLVVVPYRLVTDHLSTMIGSHISTPSLIDVNWLDNTENSKEEQIIEYPETIRDVVIEMKSRGLPEAKIAEKVIMFLIEKKDVETLKWCLQHFRDISEVCLKEALVFCLSEPASLFCAQLQNGGDDISLDKEIEKSKHKINCENGPKGKCLVPRERAELMNVILSVPFSDVCLLPHLRAVPFTFSLSLLDHLGQLVEDEGTGLQAHIIEWICLLLDAHYQQYLLSRDPQVLKILSRLMDLISSQLSYTDDLKMLMPLLDRLKGGKLPVKSQILNDKYSLKLLQLY